MPSPVLSIVLGSYNRLDQIRGCLESIARETRLPHVVYVTDAGSTDGTVEYLRSVESETVRPLLIGQKLGQARAYNDVFATVDTPYVCWVSDDNEVVNQGLDVAVRILQGDERIGMVALKVRDRQGPFVDAPYIGGLSSLGILNVNQGMLPTRVLKEVGGFSETFRDYGIDPDLTAKVLFCGYDIVYTRQVAIHHYRSWSTDPNTPEFHALKAKHERSIKLYQDKYGSFLPRSTVYDLKRRAFSKLVQALGPRWRRNGTEPMLGQLPRDWHNIFNGRFISLIDPILCAGKPYHLRQRWPAFTSRPGCPPEPDLSAAD